MAIEQVTKPSFQDEWHELLGGDTHICHVPRFRQQKSDGTNMKAKSQSKHRESNPPRNETDQQKAQSPLKAFLAKREKKRSQSCTADMSPQGTQRFENMRVQYAQLLQDNWWCLDKPKPTQSTDQNTQKCASCGILIGENAEVHQKASPCDGDIERYCESCTT